MRLRSPIQRSESWHSASNTHVRPGPDTITIRHVAFRASRFDYEQAQEELRRRNITFKSQDHVIAHSIYFQDPDGHEIEITTYEL